MRRRGVAGTKPPGDEERWHAGGVHLHRNMHASVYTFSKHAPGWWPRDDVAKTRAADLVPPCRRHIDHLTGFQFGDVPDARLTEKRVHVVTLVGMVVTRNFDVEPKWRAQEQVHGPNTTVMTVLLNI